MDYKTNIITYFKLSEKEKAEAPLLNNLLYNSKSKNTAMGYAHIAILNFNGTVSAIGDNSKCQCDTHLWCDVIKVAAGDYHTVALKSDGTVVAVGDNTYGQCNVELWTNISDIFAEKGLTIGVTANGTI